LGRGTEARRLGREEYRVETVQLHWTAQTVITIAAIGNLLLFAGLAFFAFKLKSIVTDTVEDVLEKTLPRVQPVLDNVTEVTGKVSDIVERVAPRVEHMAADSESTLHEVTNKVKTTSDLVTEGVARPVVNIASLLTGVQKGIEVYKEAKVSNGSEVVTTPPVEQVVDTGIQVETPPPPGEDLDGPVQQV
jgi:hypothetical protein